ncbi:hypothetical protein ACFOWE_32125 [Planomonospora corallina]|uniref:Uncharacterized protein n=1 Tax=Planomonospora corallina TaxID=1806052 RepID=A0ABV8IKG7_9ACTN
MYPEGAGRTPLGLELGEFAFLYGHKIIEGVLTVIGLLVCLALSLAMTASLVTALLHPLLRRLPALRRRAVSPAGSRSPESARWWLGED